MTDTARYADVVLPATTFLEHHELRNGYGAYGLLYGEPAIAPVGAARPNYAVFGELIERLGLALPGDDFTPLGLLRAVAGDEALVRTLERDRIAFPPGGTHPVQFGDVFPRTEGGKIELVPASLERPGEPPFYTYLPDPGEARFPLALVSSSHVRMVSSTFGQLLAHEIPLTMHPDDARARKLSPGDTVRVWNELGEVVTGLELDPHLRPGVVELPKGLWSHHTRNGATANALAPDTLTDRSGGACFNDARVEVERV